METPFNDSLPIFNRSNARYDLRIDTIQEEEYEVDDIIIIDYDDESTLFKKIRRFLCGCCCRPKKVKMY